MILTDREIQIAIEQKQILLNPRPDDLSTVITSTAIDLTLSATIRRWKAGAKNMVVTPAHRDYDIASLILDMTEQEEVSGSIIISPEDFILGWTNEVIGLPSVSRIAARVEGKSSLARLGLGIHVTAPVIHAGFEGQIQLEIKNSGNLRIQLEPGMKICQIVFEQTLGTPVKGYSGQFLNQKPA